MQGCSSIKVPRGDSLIPACCKNLSQAIHVSFQSRFVRWEPDIGVFGVLLHEGSSRGRLELFSASHIQPAVERICHGCLKKLAAIRDIRWALPGAPPFLVEVKVQLIVTTAHVAKMDAVRRFFKASVLYIRCLYFQHRISLFRSSSLTTCAPCLYLKLLLDFCTSQERSIFNSGHSSCFCYSFYTWRSHRYSSILSNLRNHVPRVSSLHWKLWL